MSDSLVFDTVEPIEVPVSIGKHKYVLREASGAAACKWRNAQLKASKIVDGKVSGLEGMPDTEPLLISYCLFCVDSTGAVTQTVPLEIIRGWPYRIQRGLFAKLKEISALEEKETKATLEKRQKEVTDKLKGLEEDEAKNLPEAMPGGSA